MSGKAEIRTEDRMHHDPSATEVSYDTRGRPLRSLRISVTDKCNLRCRYCMPEEHYVWLDSARLLSFDEILRLTDIFLRLGVTKVRLTGGEPLLRQDLCDLISKLAVKPAIDDFALTTNGVLLAGMARELKTAGLRRITISLDTLREDRFVNLSQRRTHHQVLAGIQAAVDAGFQDTKLDTVVIRGVNDDELVDLLEFAATVSAEIRFVEYMDVGGATQWKSELVYSRRDMLASIAAHFGSIEPIWRNDSAPADRFRLPDGRTFGIISSTTKPFCAKCDRARLTADGIWLLCLYATDGLDLRTPIRDGASDADIGALVDQHWRQRTDQGAVDRLMTNERGVFIPVDRLREQPHLEMHTRGG